MNDVLKVEEKYPELFTDYQHTNIGTNEGVNGYPISILIFLGANAQLNEWSLDGVVWNGFTAADSDTTIVKHLTYPFLSGPNIKLYARNTNAGLSPGWAERAGPPVEPATMELYYGHISAEFMVPSLRMTALSPPGGVVVPGVPAETVAVTFGTTGNLFPGEQLSPSNSRFIHMNPWTQQQSNKSPLHGVSVRQELGCDCATGPSATSCPLFMYCDSTRTTKANGGGWFGTHSR